METKSYRDTLVEQVKNVVEMGLCSEKSIPWIDTHLHIRIVKCRCRHNDDNYTVVNVGRGTLLANFVKCARTMDSHVDSVMKYRAWLFNKLQTDRAFVEEIRRLADIAVDGLSLYCPGHCLFNGLPCHTQIIAAAIVYLDEVDQAEAEAATEEHFGRYGY